MKEKASSSRWIKCISQDGHLRGVAIQATDLVQHAVQLHGLKGTGARGLGEAIVGALLLGSYCKAGQRVNLNVRGSGFYSQALVDAHPGGTVRGFVTERQGMTPEVLKEQGEIGPWGSGVLSVLRTKDGESRQPYIGTVALLTGHLAKDLTYYWANSEQVPSAVGLLTEIGAEGKVLASGGFLVQAMPDADVERVASIEKQIADLGGLAASVAREASPLSLLGRIFQDTSFMVLEERPISYACSCSLERARRTLLLLGADELEAILREQRQEAEISCDFCRSSYRFGAAELEDLIQKLKPAVRKNDV